jgi:hypothetical protein
MQFQFKPVKDHSSAVLTTWLHRVITLQSVLYLIDHCGIEDPPTNGDEGLFSLKAALGRQKHSPASQPMLL